MSKILNEALAVLKRVGFVKNHAGFSEDYLNKGPRYYDHLVCSRTEPSISALVSLFIRIRAIADGFVRVQAGPAAEMETLAGALWTEIARRCCAVLPQRAKRPGVAFAHRHRP
ncbi:DUF6626 family protein [Belnapia sp. F-4-1]|uniref:DUF6626 family protein n=1 Tax=Belnapia sp. F-4-1 TaxID=1545443 RepID=UPI001185827C|nr:DUF6626 family protein [Belnapia sp. F-4-1]